MHKGSLKYICLLVCCCGIVCGAPRIDVAADPTEVRAGGVALISITVDAAELRDRPELPEVPGGRWLANRTSVAQRHSYVNGRGMHSITYTVPLRLDVPGEVEIPPITAALENGGRIRSAPLRIKVLAPGERGSHAHATELSGRIAAAATGDRTDFFVGEEIPLELTLTVPRRVRIQEIDFPLIRSDGRMILPDLPKERSRHPHFTRVRQGTSGSAQVVIFDTVARFLAPGKFSISAEETVGVAVRRRSRDDDFFGEPVFGALFDTAEIRKVTVDYPPLEVKISPLPPPPAGVCDLKLVGDWRIETTLSARSAPVGEPLELKLALRGPGNAEALAPPSLELPGFRVYPPEVKHDPERGTSVVYALIPLKPGEFDIAPAFAVFDPVQREYRVWRRDFRIAVTGSAASTAPPPKPQAATPPAPDEKTGPDEPKRPVRDDLFYQRPSRGSGVKTPLRRNHVPTALACFAAAAVLAAVWELLSRRSERRAADPALAYRLDRRGEYRRVLNALRSGGDVSETLHNGGIEMLAEALELPAGSGIPEIAEKIGDAELREFLLALETSAFAPGGNAGVKLSSSLRRRLIGIMKKALAVLLFLGGAAALDAAEAYNADFDRGDFAAAAQVYLKSADGPAGTTYPDAWYNAGNAEYNRGDLPLARLYLERAHLLAPRDAEIAENLNLVNRALMLPEVDRADTPSALVTFCRDRLRPDEYLALALFSAGAALVVLAARRRWRRGAFITAGVLGCVTLLALAAMWSQLAGSYSSSRMIVGVKELELRTLPVENSGRVEAKLPGGGDATLIEERGEWVRISVNGADGWTKKENVAAVLPGGVF